MVATRHGSRRANVRDALVANATSQVGLKDDLFHRWEGVWRLYSGDVGWYWSRFIFVMSVLLSTQSTSNGATRRIIALTRTVLRGRSVGLFSGSCGGGVTIPAICGIVGGGVAGGDGCCGGGVEGTGGDAGGSGGA